MGLATRFFHFISVLPSEGDTGTHLDLRSVTAQATSIGPFLSPAYRSLSAKPIIERQTHTMKKHEVFIMLLAQTRLGKDSVIHRTPTQLWKAKAKSGVTLDRPR